MCEHFAEEPALRLVKGAENGCLFILRLHCTCPFAKQKKMASASRKSTFGNKQLHTGFFCVLFGDAFALFEIRPQPPGTIHSKTDMNRLSKSFLCVVFTSLPKPSFPDTKHFFPETFFQIYFSRCRYPQTNFGAG